MPGGLLLISFEHKKFVYTSFVAFNIQNVCTILCRKQILMTCHTDKYIHVLGIRKFARPPPPGNLPPGNLPREICPPEICPPRKLTPGNLPPRKSAPEICPPYLA